MFSVDKSLNYGRKNIEHFCSSISNVEMALDIGAGNGSDLLSVKKYHPKASLHGIECYPPCIKVLQENNINATSLNFENESLPFNDETFDLIISNQMLEHSKEVFWVLDQVSRVLKVGGSLILGVPNLASLHNRLLLAMGRQPTCIQNDSAHIRGFTKPDILKLIRIFSQGYSVKKFSGSNFYPFSPIIAKPLAHFFPTMAWGIFLHLKKNKPYNGAFLQHPKTNKLETNFYLGQQ